jgi:N-(5'phosphoribosyl)anthranilate (PRA) isomerase
MRIAIATVSGADDTVSPDDLLALTRIYPFVEWGILLSRSREGTPRYPSHQWIRQLMMVKSKYNLPPEAGGEGEWQTRFKTSGHLCGSWARDLTRGNLSFFHEQTGNAYGFDRFQINFDLSKDGFNVDAVVKALIGITYIIQVKGNDDSIVLALRTRGAQAYPLFDSSGGAGIEPSQWPKKKYDWSGFAGGLDPDHLEDQLDKISKIAGDQRVWVDIESGVQTDNRLDLKKVEKYLSIIDSYRRKT